MTQCWSILKAHAEALPLNGALRDAGRRALRRVRARSVRPCGEPSAGCTVGPIGIPPEDRRKRRRAPDLFQHGRALPRDAACLRRTARGRAQGDRGSWRTWTIFRSSRPSHPCAAPRPTSIPTSRPDRSCSGMSRTSIATPIRSRSFGVRGRDLRDWLERAASIYHGSTRTTHRHNRSSTTASPATISTGSTGCSMTSTSACPPEPMPTASASSTRPGASGTSAMPTDARRPRGGRLWSSRIPTALRAAALSPPAPEAKRCSRIRPSCGITSSISSAPDPNRSARNRPHPSGCGFRRARPVLETGSGAIHHPEASCRARDWFPSDPKRGFRPACDDRNHGAFRASPS
jgi:hypothetical protein